MAVARTVTATATASFLSLAPVAVGAHNAALTASHKQPRATAFTASAMTATRRGNIGGGGAAQRPQLKPRRSRYGSLVSVASLVAFLKAAAEERYFECRNKRWCRI